MTAVNNLLDKYRETCSIASDNALGETLGVKRQAVHQWRKGLSWPSDEHVVEMAAKINEAPGAWLAAVHADRTSDKAAKKVWLQAAQSLGYAALIALTIGLSPAHAETSKHALQVSAESAPVYIMRNEGCPPLAWHGPRMAALFDARMSQSS